MRGPKETFFAKRLRQWNARRGWGSQNKLFTQIGSVKSFEAHEKYMLDMLTEKNARKRMEREVRKLRRELKQTIEIKDQEIEAQAQEIEAKDQEIESQAQKIEELRKQLAAAKR